LDIPAFESESQAGCREKSVINRREWLLGVGVVAGAAAQSANGLAWSEGEAHKTRKCALDLSGFEPNSMLQVHESRVERARFLVIDFHTQITVAAKSKNGIERFAERKYLARPKNFSL
jgi:hypothetical protein